MVPLVILIQGLSLTLHVYVQLHVYARVTLKISKGKAIYFITNKDIWGFWLDIFFKKFCFLTNKYGRPASTETTNLVINAYFIGTRSLCHTI